MTDHPQFKMLTTEDIIKAALDTFRAPRGSKTVFAGRRKMTVRTPGEKVLYLPNGSYVKINTDDSGIATQVEETDNLHAISRPKSIHVNSRTKDHR